MVVVAVVAAVAGVTVVAVVRSPKTNLGKDQNIQTNSSSCCKGQELSTQFSIVVKEQHSASGNKHRRAERGRQ